MKKIVKKAVVKKAKAKAKVKAVAKVKAKVKSVAKKLSVKKPVKKPVKKSVKKLVGEVIVGDEVSSMLLPPDYVPRDDEEYMNSLQLEYFRRMLLRWKSDLLEESRETLGHLREESLAEADVIDRAVQESNHALELRTRDRYRKLIQKIDLALERIIDGSYGYCEETGAPIGIRRLGVRPIATLCLEAQEAHEREERKNKGA